MALNDLLKQPVGSSRPRFANTDRTKGSRPAAGVKDAESSAKTKLERLARPTRTPDFYLVDEGSEASRPGPGPTVGLSAPKANASRSPDKQTPPQMQASTPAVATLPKVSQPRVLELHDVQGDARAHKHLQAFDVVPVQGDGLTSLVAAMLHHGSNHPASAAALADGLHALEEPTGETSTEAHAGFAMLKRWAQALKDGRGHEAAAYALGHPAVIAALARAMRGIVRHMQVFGAMKRPAKDRTGPAADLEAMHALAGVCGLKLTTHEAGKPVSVDTGSSTLHMLSRGTPGHLDVLVPKKA